jgi:hypothetical protein
MFPRYFFYAGRYVQLAQNQLTVLDESNTQGQGHARVPRRRQDKIREDMFNYPQTAYKGKTNYSDLTESKIQ